MGIARFIPVSIRRWHTFQVFAWIRSTRRLRAMFASERPTHSGDGSAPSFGVLVTPWLATTIPWYSLVVAECLARAGSKVTLVVDDLPFGAHPVRSFFIRRCIRIVVDSLADRFPIIVLSAEETPTHAEPGAVTDSLIERLARLNAVHALKGETLSNGRAQYEALVERQLRHAAPGIECVASRRPFDAIFIPGGIYGSTGLWLDACRRHRIRVASHDSGGYGTLMLAADGVAAQLQDVPRAFELLRSSAHAQAEFRFSERVALGELERRRAGKDAFTSQVVASSVVPDHFHGAVLVALNSSWDQAALGLHVAFRDNREWLVETVRYVLDSTDRTVIVRQHPAERLEIARTTDDYRALLGTEFGLHPRLRFIAADEEINTYDVLMAVAAVTVYTSTIGVEAAALGRPVVAASRSYYANIGFIANGTDRADYFRKLRLAIDGGATPTSVMQQHALCCYYLAQVCNWIFSPFNPEGYAEWRRLTLEEISRLDAVQVVVRSLLDNVPAAYLNHLGRMRDAGLGQCA